MEKEKKYVCQQRMQIVIMDVKEEFWLPKVKYLSHNFMGICKNKYVSQTENT